MERSRPRLRGRMCSWARMSRHNFTYIIRFASQWQIKGDRWRRKNRTKSNRINSGDGVNVNACSENEGTITSVGTPKNAGCLKPGGKTKNRVHASGISFFAIAFAPIGGIEN